MKKILILFLFVLSCSKDSESQTSETLSNIEDSLILQALEQTSGNKNQASKLLSMNRTTLIEKMKKNF